MDLNSSIAFNKDLSHIKAVVFDVFGTLADIHDKRQAFGQLLKWGEQHKRKPLADDSRRILCNDVGLAGAADLLGIKIPLADLADIERELHDELCSIKLFSETSPVLFALKQSGYKLAVCSNIAAPYIAPVLGLLQIELNAYIWSSKVGAIKPEAAIYTRLLAELECLPSETIFIGDARLSDYAGPRAVGMHSFLLNRDKPASTAEEVRSLFEVLVKLGRDPKLLAKDKPLTQFVRAASIGAPLK